MSLHRAPAALVATVSCLAANLGLSAGPAAAATTTAGSITFPAATAATVQNPHTRAFTVMRAGGSTGAASAVCHVLSGTAVSGKDFNLITSTVQWASGDATSKACSVTILDATPFTGAKSFTLEVTNPVGAAMGSTGKTVVSIYGNKGAGAVSLGSTSYAFKQNVGSGTVTVNRTGGSVGAAVVQYATANMSAVAGTDYTPVHGQLYWAGGDATARTVSIPIKNAKAFTGSKTLAIALALPENVTLGAQTSAVVTVNGDASTATPTPPPVTSPPVATSGQVSRPSYNTGPGFFVLNGKLYDANGNEFRIRGVDRNHYDSISQPGISKTGANAVRIMVATNYGASVARLVSIVQNDHINYKEVPIVMTTETPAGADTSCSSDATVVAAAVANWVATASSWTPLDKYTIINIANEWGPTNSTVWRDSNISAIAKMRAAGYMGTLMIDAGGCGQDMEDLVNYSGAVFSSDPQKNVIFALHAYYNTTPANVASRFQQLASLAASTGAAYAVTEFGPGRDIGPSPTLLTPGEVITNAEANGLGWCAWAWDDNDLGNGASDNNWFSMTLKGPGTYTQASDLTIFGTDVVLNGTYGLSVLAKPASIF
jgi:hypothetical protein